MKTLNFLLMLLLSTGVLISFNGRAAAQQGPPVKKERNMFGHYIPRGLSITSEGLMPGYVMFNVPNSASIFLINRKGEVVHEWKGNYGAMAVSPYLMGDGSVIQMTKDPDFPIFAGGGESGRLQKISWNGEILWDFEYASEEYHAHHDLAVMPNGNILAIAWEAISAAEALQKGRKPELIPKAGVWPDKIVEIEPQGKNGGKVVWEWHMWDHLVQDHDPEKANFGDPAEHPELLDINLGEALPAPISQDSLNKQHALGMAWRNQTLDNRGSDLFHTNAINYNAELDQIAFSSPTLNEIFIVDHSTTSLEAAGHKGGKRGKGGDFLYRWGNPQNYRQGDSTSQQLFGQHDIRWIDKGLPGAGNLTLFNNDIPGRRDSLNYSAILEIIPSVDKEGNYMLMENQRFGPEAPAWQYIAPDTISFFASFVSGAHRMQNGNTFINEGPRGRFMEVTPAGKTVWEYLNPYRGDARKLNGDPIPAMPITYMLFRSTFIAADHPALAGRKLVPLNPQPNPFKLPPKPARATVIK